MTESTISAPRRGVPIWAQIIVWVFLVGLLEGIRLALFEREGAHDPHTGHAGLHTPAHLAQGSLSFTGAAEELTGKAARDQQDQGHGQ